MKERPEQATPARRAGRATDSSESLPDPKAGELLSGFDDPEEWSAARRQTVARLRLQIAVGAYRAPVDDLVARLLPIVLGPRLGAGRDDGWDDEESAPPPPFVYWPRS